MADNKAAIGALLFILLIIVANFVMYAIARGAARSNGKSFLQTLGQALNTSNQKKDSSIDELRQKVEALKSGRKDDPPGAQ